MDQNTLRLAIILPLLILTSQAFAWGQTGHRVTGELAQAYLSTESKDAVGKIIGTEDLAEASTYADEMRSNPTKFWQKTASPWHYVNVKIGDEYKKAPSEGDAVSALAAFSETVTNPTATLKEKQLALRFIVHIIGDLHQPFHSGTSRDRGGNNVQVKFFREASNIHRVWDSQLIDRQKLSYTEWTKRLQRKISKQQFMSWQQTDPKIWIAEAVTIRKGLYPDNDDLSWDYQYKSMPIIEERLQAAGVRIAAYLNKLFGA